MTRSTKRKKVTRFSDIPQLTRSGYWECDFSFDYLIQWIAEQVSLGLDLDPDFQRGHVWTQDQQSRFVEFHFRGGTTGRVIYLNCPTWHGAKEYADFVIVDGKQRLEALRRFVNNEIRAFGSLFREFTDSRRMMQNTMKVNVNNLKSRAEVLQWYLDMNTGGVVHSPEEIDRVRRLLKKETSK